MKFSEMKIKCSYTGKGKSVLNEFLLPVLSASKTYDRVTGFYSIESLLAISQGITSVYENHGKIRLIVGVHSFPHDFIDATLQRKLFEDQIDKIRKEIAEKLISLKNALERERLITIAWMIEDGLMEIRAASIEEGIFHPKTLIFTDEVGNRVAAIGSPNETRNGLGSNFEQLLVVKSWKDFEAVDDQVRFFEDLWNGQVDGVYVNDISADTADLILDSLNENHREKELEEDGIIRSVDIIKESAQMPANFFVSGNIPALYMHQERAVIDALSRWPVRVLFADEVGLGKTFEAAATMVFLIKYCAVKRAIILTPKSVLKQWQEELHDHFGINIWRYDSTLKQYISPDEKIISMSGKNPIGKSSPDLILMSAQYARGAGDKESIFDKDGSILPDLLVLDEAHSARVSLTLDGSKKKTRMYKMLEKVANQIPHIILATATPMQKDAGEYHAMLRLLGLPKAWTKERAFKLSLKIIASNSQPDISDASSIALMLNAVIEKMKPDTSRLDKKEFDLLQKMRILFGKADKYDIGCFVQENWDVFRSLLIKTHPARLLTVRNTRRALMDVGYVFPKRNLIEKNVTASNEMLLFYSRVNQYITTESFSVERALSPDKKFNVGFIRINYQQRVASSLYSCTESLRRRYLKMRSLRKLLLDRGVINSKRIAGLNFELPLDEIDDDELMLGNEEHYDFDEIRADIDVDELRRAVNLECTSLSGLLSQAQRLLNKSGDQKIATSIDLAVDCLSNDDTVLLFSRYTDTIDSLIYEFKKNAGIVQYPYGIYTGQKAAIVKQGTEFACDKSTIKAELFSRNIRIVFCSDAASEGLNLQAARVLINVDVPWTPARLEQRIGRIARLGQTASEVDIYNVWYPNSIEARMYHRIQKRLKDANLAIGEFPEVIANNIKNAVLENRETDDSGLKELMEVRNSYQTQALQELWSYKDEKTTTSTVVRQHLIELCDKEFESVASALGGKIKTYIMPDESKVELTAEAGMSESISLNSVPFIFKQYHIPNIYVKYDNSGYYAAFLYGISGDYIIRHEDIFELIDHELTEAMISQRYPKMLPNMNNMTLDYSTDCEIDEKPDLWLIRGKQNES